MRPSFADAGLDPDGRAVLRDRVELLVHRQRDAHRPADEERADGHHRFELDVQLRAEAAAQKRRADPHPILRPSEQPADLRADERRTLRRRVNRQAVRAVQFGERHDRLERRVNHLAGAKGVLEDVVGLGEPLLHVAPAHAGVERDVGARAAGEVLEIGEHARRLQHVVNDRRAGRAAATSSNTASSGSYSTTIRSAASSAMCGSVASTTATGSPTWRTFSSARIG